MCKINITVTGAQAAAQISGPLTSGMMGVPVQFTFDESWERLTKTAVFRAGNKTVDRVDIQETTTVPWEVLEKKNCTLYIGVFGVNADGTLVIPTVWAEVGVIQPGADPSGDESTDPSLPVWQQALKEAVDAKNEAAAAAAAAEEVRTAYENGKLKGEKGDAGDLATVFFADDGEGNVTLGTKSAGMQVQLTDDGNGNIKLEVV